MPCLLSVRRHKETEGEILPFREDENFMSDELKDQVPTNNQDRTDDPADNPGDEKQLPQSQVNALIAKEAKKAQEKLLRQLGVEDINNAKDALEKYKSLQDEQKTELQRAQDLAASATKEKDSLTTQIESLTAEIAAMKLGVLGENTADVVALAKNYLSDDVDLQAAIANVVEKYPHFKGEKTEQDQDTPTFTKGTHQKGAPLSDLDKWKAAFAPKK